MCVLSFEILCTIKVKLIIQKQNQRPDIRIQAWDQSNLVLASTRLVVRLNIPKVDLFLMRQGWCVNAKNGAIEVVELDNQQSINKASINLSSKRILKLETVSNVFNKFSHNIKTNLQQLFIK